MGATASPHTRNGAPAQSSPVPSKVSCGGRRRGEALTRDARRQAMLGEPLDHASGIGEPTEQKAEERLPGPEGWGMETGCQRFGGFLLGG